MSRSQHLRPIIKPESSNVVPNTANKPRRVGKTAATLAGLAMATGGIIGYADHLNHVAEQTQYAQSHSSDETLRVSEGKALELANKIYGLYTNPPKNVQIAGQPGIGPSINEQNGLLDLNFSINLPKINNQLEVQYLFSLKAMKDSKGLLQFTPGSMIKVAVAQANPNDLEGSLVNQYSYTLTREDINNGDGVSSDFNLSVAYYNKGNKTEGFRFSTDIETGSTGAGHSQLMTEQTMNLYSNQALRLVNEALALQYPSDEYIAPTS